MHLKALSLAAAIAAVGLPAASQVVDDWSTVKSADTAHSLTAGEHILTAATADEVCRVEVLDTGQTVIARLTLETSRGGNGALRFTVDQPGDFTVRVYSGSQCSYSLL